MLTYLEFLSVFVALPAGALAAVVARRTRRPRRVFAGVALLVCIAVSYTAPWDSYLIGRGVWSYGEGVVAVRFARIPLGEWLFFGLQTALTGLWYYALAHRLAVHPEPGVPEHPNARRHGLVGWTVLAALGVALASASSGTYYLGVILLWGAPVAAFLWAVGGPVVWRYRRLVAAAVAAPSIYLWVIDRFAIGSGLWTISAAHSSGVHLLGLPVEEAVFFLLTNVLIVHGLLLFDWTLARADDRGPSHALDGLLPGVRRLILDAGRMGRRWR
ncbi:lycopene cyclase domain-containing protein [Halorussus salilacus]|uniref:lycopene cyclase domain-containing protein n=1 Tax=Halorussus salilacus TaxID=2953750 RepID=UPI0020A0AA24|nr:lycopene cyclase domain-containing protein [Halorussus salilacus]USZ69255.1 lycopene cyclase domain-containing protein [Halorussus salilacus]